MIEIESSEENDAVVQEIVRRGFKSQKKEPWIGLSDADSEGTFKWVSTGREPNYTNWVRGAPNNGNGNEDCAYYNYAYNNWNDLRCDRKGTLSSYHSVALCEKL